MIPWNQSPGWNRKLPSISLLERWAPCRSAPRLGKWGEPKRGGRWAPRTAPCLKRPCSAPSGGRTAKPRSESERPAAPSSTSLAPFTRRHGSRTSSSGEGGDGGDEHPATSASASLARFQQFQRKNSASLSGFFQGVCPFKSRSKQTSPPKTTPTKSALPS